jgi:hypothetical protein
VEKEAVAARLATEEEHLGLTKDMSALKARHLQKEVEWEREKTQLLRELELARSEVAVLERANIQADAKLAEKVSSPNMRTII